MYPVAHYYACNYACCARARMFGGINFGDLIKIHQFTKLKSPQKFPAIRYWQVDDFNTSPPMLCLNTIEMKCTFNHGVHTKWKKHSLRQFVQKWEFSAAHPVLPTSSLQPATA